MTTPCRCRELDLDLADVREMLEDASGLGLVDHRDGEADMDEHVIAEPGLRHEGEVDLLDDAAEIDARGPRQRVVAGNGENLPRNG